MEELDRRKVLILSILVLGFTVIIGFISDPGIKSSRNESSPLNGSVENVSNSTGSNSSSSDTNPDFKIISHGFNGTHAAYQRYRLRVEEPFELRLGVKNTGDIAGKFSSTLKADIANMTEKFPVESEKKVEPGEEVTVTETISLRHFGYYSFTVKGGDVDHIRTDTIEGPGAVRTREGRDIGGLRTDIPEKVKFGESVSIKKGVSVKAENLSYRDAYSYMNSGEEKIKQTDFYEAFILVDLSFENSGNESFKLPETWHFKWDVAEPVKVENNSEIDQVEYGKMLESGETEEGTVVIRDAVNEEHNYPDSFLLEYDEEGLGAAWNVTEDHYFEKMERKP